MPRLVRLMWAFFANGALGLVAGLSATWAALALLGREAGVVGLVANGIGDSAGGVVVAFGAGLGAPLSVKVAGVPVTVSASGFPAALVLVAGPVIAVLLLAGLTARNRAHGPAPRWLALPASALAFAGLAALAVAFARPADTGLLGYGVSAPLVAALAVGWAVLLGGPTAWGIEVMRQGDWRRRRAAQAALSVVALLATLLTPAAAVAAPVPAPEPRNYRRPGVAEAMEAVRAQDPQAWRAAVDPRRGVPSTMTLHSPVGRDVTSWLRAHSALLGFQDVTAVLRQTAYDQDPLGRRHVWFRQVVDGVPVEYANLGVHLDPSGRYVTMLSNALRPDLVPESPRPERSADQALAVARRGMPAGDLVKAPVLTMLPLGDARPGKAVRAIPVWTVWLSDADEGASVEYLVAARGTERVVKTRNKVRHTLQRQVYDLQHKDSYKGGVLSRSEGGAPSSVAEVNEAYDRTGEVYQYLHRQLGRDSWDDEGGPMVVKVRWRKDYRNAGWTGQFTVFGDGMAKLDVVAHEWFHAVTEDVFTDNVGADLLYERESGALNESISDAFAEAVEHWVRGSNDWLIGSETKKPIRDMSDPDRLGQPGHMDDYEAKCVLDDAGGVHTNSGIPNHAFYLLSQRVRIDFATRILWWTIMGGNHGLLAATPSFADFRVQQIATAEFLYGRESEQALAVAAVWGEVGVEDDTVAPTTDRCICAINTSLGIADDGTGGGSAAQQVYLDLHELLDLADTDSSVVLTHYSRVFLDASDRMSQLMKADPAVKQQFSDLVYALHPIAQTLIDAGTSPPPLITAEHVADTNQLFDALIAADLASGGGDLANLLTTERTRVDFDQLVGRDAHQAEAYLQTFLAES